MGRGMSRGGWMVRMVVSGWLWLRLASVAGDCCFRPCGREGWKGGNLGSGGKLTGLGFAETLGLVGFHAIVSAWNLLFRYSYACFFNSPPSVRRIEGRRDNIGSRWHSISV